MLTECTSARRGAHVPSALPVYLEKSGNVTWKPCLGDVLDFGRFTPRTEGTHGCVHRTCSEPNNIDLITISPLLNASRVPFYVQVAAAHGPVCCERVRDVAQRQRHRRRKRPRVDEEDGVGTRPHGLSPGLPADGGWEGRVLTVLGLVGTEQNRINSGVEWRLVPPILLWLQDRFHALEGPVPGTA